MKGYTNCSSSTSTSFDDAKINVTYSNGGTCSITNGINTITAPNTSGFYTFSVPDGTWEIACTKNSYTVTETVHIARGQILNVSVTIPLIFGITRDSHNSSPVWTRTDDAVGYTATASLGSTPGFSSFDNKPIYKDIVRENIGNDVMVKIPKFWFKRTVDINGIETIKITERKVEGFLLHPAFQHNNTTQDYVYVGAYETSAGMASQSGVYPFAPNDYITNTKSWSDYKRATWRTKITAKGTGWGLLDITTYSAIAILMLVEFATNYLADAIGEGSYNEPDYTVLTAYRMSGACDSIPNLTGTESNDKLHSVVWRGIENLWGNTIMFLDGITTGKTVIGEYRICNIQSNYSDSDVSKYTTLSYNANALALSEGGALSITELGYDPINPAIFLPTKTSAEITDRSQYYCSVSAYYYNSNTSSQYYDVCYVRTPGVFSSVFYNVAQSYINYDGRLLYIPS